MPRSPATRRPAARRLPSVTRPDDDDDFGTTAAAGVGTESLTDDAMSVLAQMGEDASAVVVWKMSATGEAQYVTRVPAKAFSLDAIAATYGGGKYRVRILDANMGPLNDVIVTIADRPLTAPVQSGPRDDFRDRLLETLLTTMVAQPRAVAAAPATDLPALLTAIGTLLGALNKGGNASGGPNVVDMLKLVEDARRDGISLAEKLGTGSGDDSTQLLAIARELGVPLMEAVKIKAAQEAAARTNAPRSAVPSAPTIPQNGNGAHSPDMPPRLAAAPRPPLFDAPTAPIWVKRLGPFVPLMTRWARANDDAEFYADWALRQLDDTTFAMLSQEVTRPDFAESVIAAVPPFQEYRVWFTSFLGFVQRNVIEDNADDAPSGDDAESTTEDGGDATE